MGVSKSKFSAMIPTELHTLSLMLQAGASINGPTMGGKSATMEQSTPVKPNIEILQRPL